MLRLAVNNDRPLVSLDPGWVPVTDGAGFTTRLVWVLNAPGKLLVGRILKGTVPMITEDGRETVGFLANSFTGTDFTLTGGVRLWHTSIHPALNFLLDFEGFRELKDTWEGTP